MSSKRFSVMNPDPTGVWEPSTLTIDTVSSRSETLSFVVQSERGRGSILAKGEVWAERRDPSYPGMGGRVPHGHEVIRFELEAPNKVGARQSFGFATVVADEILAGAKELRRSKPRVPHGKTADDEVWTCQSCGVRTMSRGSDNRGWKGVQMYPQDPTYTYFCTKSACRSVMDTAIEKAKVNWGYEDTSGAPPETQPPPKEADDLPMPFVGSTRRS